MLSTDGMPLVVPLAQVKDDLSICIGGAAMGMTQHNFMETMQIALVYGCVKGYRLEDGKHYMGFHAIGVQAAHGQPCGSQAPGACCNKIGQLIIGHCIQHHGGVGHGC